jgi:hypothetical protein
MDRTPKDIAVDTVERERAESLAVERVLPWAVNPVLTAARSTWAKVRRAPQFSMGSHFVMKCDLL